MKRLIALLVVAAATAGVAAASSQVSSLSLPAGQYYELGDLGGQVFGRGALYVLDTSVQPNALYRIRI